MRSVLLVSFHFPPIKGGSGVQRTLRFAQYLPKYGWRPIVLSVQPRAYKAVSPSVGSEVPRDLEVHRAFGLDASMHLSLFGRYPRVLALPDRWATWRIRAVPMAMRIIKSTKVDAIWSTFPIATAHLIALEAARRSNLPWLAEFRDPMCDGDYPPDPIVNRAWRSLEREVFAQADSIVVTTPGTAALYAKRFPQVDASRIIVIENGYDEEAFARATVDADFNIAGRRGGPLVLLHSGLIYPSERDPTQFFQALALLKRARKISAADVRIILRASGNEADYGAQLAALEIGDIVKLEPGIDYLPALREMLTVDGLIVLQAANCNSQIPAKLYEYLRAGRPILALTDPSGDTARVLNKSATGRVAPLDSTEDISVALVNFIKEIRENTWRGAPPDIVRSYSRELQAGRLAQALNGVVESKSRGLVS